MLTKAHRGWLRNTRLGALAFVMVAPAAQPALAQRIFWDSVGTLPGTLTRVEYENLDALRKMPHFASLRGNYAGSFKQFEDWLTTFGLREEDVAELLVGLDRAKDGTHTFAIACGQFQPTPAADVGRLQSPLVLTKIADLTGYCSQGTCALFREGNWAALGRKEFLGDLVGGGDGRTEALASEPAFMDLAVMIPRDAPLWGIARDGNAAQWLKAVMPSANSVPIVWSEVLRGLDGIAYSVTPDDDQLRVTVNLEYKTSAGAALMGVTLEGVKAIESVLWRTEHAGQANPFSGAEVSVDDRAVSLALSASYDSLESGLVLGRGE